MTPYQLYLPESESSCAIFNSPHSGSEYPQDLLNNSDLDLHEIRSSEDVFVDELFSASVGFGAPLLTARFPRAYVDLNRAMDELDPAVVHGAPRRGTNPRIAAGLGVIPRVVSEGRAIMRGKISFAEAENRLAIAYHPYHQALSDLIAKHFSKFGAAILCDCHSMPHEALASVPPVAGQRPDVILGDRFGASCDYQIVDAVAAAFAGAGFVVARNAPFAGGFITQHYGRPSQNVHAIQIEIDRSLYMDEVKLLRSASFERVKTRLETVIRQLCAMGPMGLHLAAE